MTIRALSISGTVRRTASEIRRPADCQCGQKDWNQPILAPRKSVSRVAGHLKRKLAIAPFVEQLSVGWFLDR
jgi:hypothetical protein